MIGLLDIGGTKLLAASGDMEGRLGAIVRRPTPASGDILGVLVDMLDEGRRGRELTAVSAAVPGPFDRHRGALVNPPGLSSAWHGLEMAAGLGEHFGCPVRLENDANCAALAEAHLGAGRDRRLVVYFTVSTGIGSGVVRDGRLAVERHDTEGGHQVVWPQRTGGPACDCGGNGCLEAIASGRALHQRFHRPPAEIDEPAVWDEVGYWLGVAAVNAVALLDCDCVVFGGGVASSRWSELEPALRAAVADHLHLQAPPAIRPAQLGEERNLFGALLLARDAVGEVTAE